MSTPTDGLAGLVERRRDLIAAAVIVLAAAVFFAPFLFGGRNFLAGDTLYSFYPWKSYASDTFRPRNPLITDPVNHNYAEIYNRQLKAGRLSDWNPYFYTGLPANAITAQQGVSGRSYPVKRILHRFFTTPVAHDLLLLFHIIVMGLGMYLYLKEIGAGLPGALFGAVAYMFNGCAMVWLEFETTVAAFAFFPLALICMERFRSSARYFYAFAGAAVVGTMALMGHIQYLIYTYLLLGFYLLFLVVRALLEKSGRREVVALISCFAILCLGSVLVAALDILPIAEFMGLSSRIDRGFTFESFFTTLGRVPFRYYVTLIFPDYFGSPVLQFNAMPALPTQEYMNYCELTLFAGVPALFAFLGLAAAPRTAHGRFFLGMTFLLVLMLSGTFVYYPFFALVPGMDKMNPTRLVFLFNLVFAAGAGLGLDGLRRLGARQRAIFLGLALALGVLTLALALGSGNPRLVSWFNAELVKNASAGVAGALGNLRSLTAPIILKPLIVALLSLALVTVLACAGSRRIVYAVAFSLLLALLAGELIAFGRSYNTTVEPKHLYARTPAIEFLLRQPQPFRVVQHGGSGFSVNTLGPFGIEEAGGYSSFYPKSFNKLASYIEAGDWAFKGARLDRWVVFKNVNSPIFNVMDARYFLVAPGYPFTRPDTKLVYRGEIDIYENTAALPRAYAVHSYVVTADENRSIALLASGSFDYRNSAVLETPPSPAFPAGSPLPGAASQVTIERYGNDETLLTATMAAAGLVVFSNALHPGWVATVDGKQVPIVRANVNYQAVPVPPGRHTVGFAFRPASARRGAWSALAGVLFIIGGLARFSPVRPADLLKRISSAAASTTKRNRA